MSKLKRIWQHWLHPRWRVETKFPNVELQRISDEIDLSEQNHLGQIRFVIESSYSIDALLKGIDTRKRAWQWFGKLGVWDTERNSGVLVYVSFADHVVEIVADRGISAKVSQNEWQRVCQLILGGFKKDAYIEGLEEGLNAIDEILTTHFPRHLKAPYDELPNDIVLH